MKNYNPIMREVCDNDHGEAAALFELARDKVRQYEGMEPHSIAITSIRDYRDKYGPDVSRRIVSRWDVSLSEGLITKVEEASRNIWGEDGLSLRRDQFNKPIPLQPYRMPDATKRPNIRGYVFGSEIDGFNTGIFVGRFFKSETEAKRIPQRDRRWLYQSRGVIESREEHNITELNFIENLVQLSRALAGKEAVEPKRLVYDIYRTLTLRSIDQKSEGQLAGLESVLEFLRWNVLAAAVNPSISQHYDLRGQSVVIASVPGLGKTTLAKVLATEDHQSLFIPLEATSLLELTVEKAGQQGAIFQSVRRLQERTGVPIVLYCDDIEAAMIDSSRSGGKEYLAGTSSLLNKLQGIFDGRDIRLCGATNNPMIIDPRFLQFGRVGYVLHVPLPDQKAREATFQIHTCKKPIRKGYQLRKMAEATEGFTNRHIEEVCNVAAQSALRRCAASLARRGESPFEAIKRVTPDHARDFPLTAEDFQTALKQVRRSTNLDYIKKLDAEIRAFCNAYNQNLIGFR